MTFRASVERYLGAVAQQYRRGDAREESYYDVLKQLWEELGSQLRGNDRTRPTLSWLRRRNGTLSFLIIKTLSCLAHDTGYHHGSNRRSP